MVLPCDLVFGWHVRRLVTMWCEKVETKIKFVLVSMCVPYSAAQNSNETIPRAEERMKA